MLETAPPFSIVRCSSFATRKGRSTRASPVSRAGSCFCTASGVISVASAHDSRSTDSLAQRARWSMLIQCVTRVCDRVRRVRCGNGVPGSGMLAIGVLDRLSDSSLRGS